MLGSGTSRGGRGREQARGRRRGRRRKGRRKVALNERTGAEGAGKKGIVQEDGEGGGNVND